MSVHNYVPSGYSALGIVVWAVNGMNLFAVWGELTTTPRVRFWNGRTSTAALDAGGFIFCKPSQ